MIERVSPEVYYTIFPTCSHPFISEPYIKLNRHKIKDVLFLKHDSNRIGIILGANGTIARAPFSAPFGGIHYKNPVMFSTEIDHFWDELSSFLSTEGFTELHITFPPDIYEPYMNAKCINALMNRGLVPCLPEITQWIDLRTFSRRYPRNVRELLSNARRKGLSFQIVTDHSSRQAIYDIIYQNRTSKNRPIYMNMADLAEVENLFPVDFGAVYNPEGNTVAGSIFYRPHPSIVYAVFWGDTLDGRHCHAMDFLADSLWNHYQQTGYEIIDLSISTESGVPNPGLLRFKESHGAVSSLRYRFKIPLH